MPSGIELAGDPGSLLLVCRIAADPRKTQPTANRLPLVRCDSLPCPRSYRLHAVAGRPPDNPWLFFSRPRLEDACMCVQACLCVRVCVHGGRHELACSHQACRVRQRPTNNAAGAKSQGQQHAPALRTAASGDRADGASGRAVRLCRRVQRSTEGKSGGVQRGGWAQNPPGRAVQQEGQCWRGNAGRAAALRHVSGSVRGLQ